MIKTSTLLILAVFLVGQTISLHATEPKSAIPDCPVGCYVIASSSLDFREVSPTYAKSIFSDVKSILYDYLGRGKIDEYFFLNGLVSDLKGGVALNLSCAMERLGDSVTLNVLISDHTTGENYLSFKKTQCFLAPRTLLEAFSSSFAEEFPLPIVRKYEYLRYAWVRSLSQRSQNKWADAVVLDGVVYSLYSKDLYYDLQRTTGVPSSMIDKLHSFATRKWAEYSIAFAGQIVSYITLALYSNAEEKKASNDARVFGTTCAVSFFASVSSLVLALVYRPKKLQGMIGDWSASACE